MNIILTGIMGCGKTTVGHMLGKRLNMKFMDMDEEIEQEHGTITGIFEREGEAHFRDIESAMALKLANLDALVISTGGGIVKRSENMEVLKKTGLVFFLDRPTEIILKKLDVSHRPLIRDNPLKLHDILAERYPLYLAQCHYRIDASGSYERTLSQIIALWKHPCAAGLQFSKADHAKSDLNLQFSKEILAEQATGDIK